MDGSRFDTLTRHLAVSGSRRRLLGGIIAGALGLAVRDRADAAACRAPGRLCREGSSCCSTLCNPKDATGRRRCACRTVDDCPVASTCRTVACQKGVCVISITPDAACDDGNACTTGDTCVGGACVGGPALVCPSGQCDALVGCVCSTSADCATGYACFHGGCFLLNPDDTSPFCFDHCGPSDIARLGGNLVCVTVIGTSCASDAGCPVGQACFANVYCIAPC